MARGNKKGCIIAILGCSGVAVVLTIVVGYFFFIQAKKFGESIANPEPKAKELLGVEAMPEGYYANFAMAIPFLMEMVIISNEETNFADQDGDSHQNIGKKGFFYFKFIELGKNKGKLKDYFDGKSNDDRVLKEFGVNVDTDEILDRGTFQFDGNDVYFFTQRGGFNAGGGSANGLSTLMLFQCPNDSKMRMGIFFGPNNQEASDEAVTTGTAADINEVQTFMSGFKFCK